MKSDQPLFLSEEQVRQHLHMAELIPAMEKALIEFSGGKVTQPVRSVINVDPPGGFLGLMPALTPDGLGLKAVTFYPSNAERGIPTHMATIFLVDPQTGVPLAIMDGRLITEMRTAAVSRGNQSTCFSGSENSRDPRERRTIAQSRQSPPTRQEFRRNSRVESYKGTCRTIRERSWRESNVSRRSSARRRCRRNYDKFQNTCAKRIVVEAWLPCERNRCMPAGLA